MKRLPLILMVLFAVACSNQSDTTRTEKDTVKVPVNASPDPNSGDTSSYERMPNTPTSVDTVQH